MPALLTSTSIRPKAETAAATPDSTSASLVTSMARAMTRSPEWSSSSAAARAATKLRSAIATRAPAAAKVRAISWPMPLAAPVTRATLSLRCIRWRSVSVQRMSSCAAQACTRRSPQDSFPSVLREIESHDALEVVRPCKHLGMAQGADRIVVPCLPVVLHAEAREFVVLRVPFVLLGAIDELDEVVHLGGGVPLEERHLRAIPKILGELLQQSRDGIPKLLGVPEPVRVVARAARVLDLLLPRHHLGDGARYRPARAPQVDLEGECVST